MGRLLIVAFEPFELEAMAGFAQKLGLPFDCLALVGSPAQDTGAEKILTAGLTGVPPADAVSASIAELAKPYSHVAAMSSMQSKDVLGRVAGLLRGSMVTDAIAVDGPTAFHRPMVAGALVAQVQTLGSPVVVTVRPSGFGPAGRGGQSSTEVVSLTLEGRTRKVSASGKSGGRPDLVQAKRIVSGGRPLKDSATFEQVIGGLADQLGGAVGATRAAVDSGIAPNEMQVGQTGKIVAPELYIAAGISGSTQHMAGIKDSKVIVAINKDPDAPIFDVADLGLVADLFDAIPEIQRLLR